MKKHIYGRRFKRDVNERKALFKSLLSELVLHERIKTTVEKAKAIKGDADRLITKAKYADKLHASTLLSPLVTADAVSKLLNDLGPRFIAREGGYTRIVKLGRRFNDDAQTAFIEWTEVRVANGEGKIAKGKKKELTTNESTQAITKSSMKKATAKKTTIKETKTTKAKTTKTAKKESK